MPQKVSHYLHLEKNLPLEVKQIFNIFLKKGDEIRLVGGCVRDLLMKKAVNDFDFATKYVPEDIMRILKDNKIQAIPTGIKFGTITAVINQQNFEITTLRKDLENDGRHCQPEFVDDYLLDAQRRDFTMNALYLDAKGNVTDYFDGMMDLENREVKFIGDPKQRVEEDYLRILRFFRFSCDYAKKLDEKGLAVCKAESKHIRSLSCERIRAEFLKLLSSDNKEQLLSILRQIEPEMAPDIFGTCFQTDRLERLFEIEKKAKITADVNVRMAALCLLDIKDLKAFLVQLCATNKEKKYLQFLLKNLSKITSGISISEMKVMLAFHEKDLVRDLYLLSLIHDEAKDGVANLHFLEGFSLPEFPLNGDDVMALGFKKKQVGEGLKKAKEAWALRDFTLGKDDLMEYVRSGLLVG